jgi:hypothetical protein
VGKKERGREGRKEGWKGGREGGRKEGRKEKRKRYCDYITILTLKIAFVNEIKGVSKCK